MASPISGNNGLPMTERGFCSMLVDRVYITTQGCQNWI